MQHSVCVAPQLPSFRFFFYYSSLLFILSLGFFHFFSSVSAITSICYLLLPVLSLLLTHFSFCPSLCWVSLGEGGGGSAVREVFPTSLSSHFSSAPLQHPMHTHASASIYLCTPPTPPPALSVRPWHKCICSIPPANRLVGCYQRQEEGDNGFHHIFSLPQIKMGQVIRHTQTHTPAFTVTNTHTIFLNILTQVKQTEFKPTQQQKDCNLAFFLLLFSLCCHWISWPIYCHKLVPKDTR